jgi:phosphoglycolate phosphatase
MLRVLHPVPADKIKLVIFDLDGTLVDSRLDLCNSVNGMLRHLGRPELPCDVVATYIGDGAPMLVRRALGDPADENFVKAALDYFLAFYREHKLDTTHVYPGVIEALRAVRSGNGGRGLAVLSNKPVNPSRAIVQALGLGEFFSQVYGGNSFETKKPDPLGIQTILQETGTLAREAVMVGDSAIDVLTGRNAGLATCGVTYGFQPETLQQVPPDVLVANPKQLGELFG